MNTSRASPIVLGSAVMQEAGMAARRHSQEGQKSVPSLQLAKDQIRSQHPGMGINDGSDRPLVWEGVLNNLEGS